jgi:hypothetical protein
VIPDTDVPFSDGWWLARLYFQLQDQQKHCELLWQRYIGNPPLPHMNANQRAAVQWFVGKARTNFERLIVNAVLSRLRIRGMRTAKDSDQGGDAEAFKVWKKTRGKMWSREVHKYAATMGRGYVIVGKDSKGKLLVTAEDPRHVTCIVDPSDPYKVVAALKLIYNTALNRDEAYLYLPGRVRVAYRQREAAFISPLNPYNPLNFQWSVDVFDSENNLITAGESSEPEWLQETADREALCPVVPFVNEDGMAEFEPHIELLDRITQQVLQRMTIATIQAFKQRAMKGLPKADPKTGEEIDYDEIFIAEPGAIWNLPASVEIWESGTVDLQPILLSIRDDIKDLAAVSGTPLYTVTPDVANGSAEGASLQRETLTFKVETAMDRFGIGHELVDELIFLTDGDEERADPGGIEVLWGPADRPSWSERANAVAQTKGAMPVYLQLTEIIGLDPDVADSAMTMLKQDQTQAAAIAAASVPRPAPGAPGAAGQATPFRKDTPPKASADVHGLPDVTKDVADKSVAS